MTVPVRTRRVANEEAGRTAERIRPASCMVTRTTHKEGPLMSPATAVVPAAAKPSSQKPRAFEVAMAPEPARVAEARRTAEAFLKLWDISGSLVDDVRLVISELVTNAMKHGHGTVSFRIRHWGSELCIEVTDKNPVPANLRDAGADDLSGRGLFLVEVLTSGWGVSDNGRTTWATFRVPERSR